MSIRFWDFPRHFATIEAEVMGEMLATLRAGDLVMRDQMRGFESAFAALIGTKRCVAVSNCTDGLRLTLLALGIGQGDEVITVGHTFVATLAAIHHAGAEPVLVDVNQSDRLMNPDLVAGAITERTRAIVPVHLDGRTCDMAAICALAADHGLLVIEDAAQAICAKFDGRTAGSFGIAAAYSFYPAKLLGAFGDGGAVVTNDDQLADKLLLLRDHGRASKTDLDGWGWNCRLDNLQASVLNVKLRHLVAWVERRREIATRYEEGLRDTTHVVTPPPPNDGRWFDVFQNYVVESPDRDALRNYLSSAGIETMISWPIPNHRQPGLKLDHFELPNTERLCNRVLSLPMYPELSDDEVDFVLDAMRSFQPE